MGTGAKLKLGYGHNELRPDEGARSMDGIALHCTWGDVKHTPNVQQNTACLEDLTCYRAGGLCIERSSEAEVRAPRGSQDHVPNTLLYLEGTKMRDSETELRFPCLPGQCFSTA